jgi:hypothetical protein
MLSNSNNHASSMMGGLGASYRGIEGPNYINPASISAIKLISFDAGISGMFENIKTSDPLKQNKIVSILIIFLFLFQLKIIGQQHWHHALFKKRLSICKSNTT